MNGAQQQIRQPYLHRLITAVRAPAVALSADTGQIRSGAQGVYVADRRVLSRLVVSFDDTEAEPVQACAMSADQVQFIGVLRELGDRGPDPTVTLERTRRVLGSGAGETVSVVSHSREPVHGTLAIEAACDLADVSDVKSGVPVVRCAVQATRDGLSWQAPDGTHVRLRADPAPDTVDAASGRLGWAVDLTPRARVDVSFVVEVVADPQPQTVLAGEGTLAGAGLVVRGGDHRLGALLERSLADLDALTVADPAAPGDRFLAAGAPWYLTLFGRDALWAARMLLPIDTSLAAGTLHALGRRQGTRIDAKSAEEPGKILHELRRAATEHEGRSGPMRLPPVYYGTVDATALWISLLHDAWRWGLPADQVSELLPVAERALGWLADYGLAQSGFIAYRDASGQGLANQGWKDSGDAVQFRDGTLAEPPIALCEVQGYAFAAAHQAADLFDAFARPGGQQWRGWADGLAQRFRAAFWIDDPEGAFPAIALDASARPVDTVTSNIGHLLGTGLLTPAEEGLVVARLGLPDMDSGYGLRTMSTNAAGFNALSYHAGSVWTHDTAIAITALAATNGAGAGDLAAALTRGLLAAGPAFDYRLPELYGGHARSATPMVVPYPASCRPQAWSAGASVAVLSAVLGLHVDVPASVIRLRPMRPSPVGALEVRGLRVAGDRLDLDLGADGSIHVVSRPPGLTVEIS